MKTLHIIPGVLLIGVLASVVNAAGEVKKDKLTFTPEQHRSVVGRVLGLVANTVADIVAENTSGGGKPPKKGLPGTFPLHDPQFNIITKSALGVSLLRFYHDGGKAEPVCTAVHLKPWIVVTTAECVREREPRRLFVEVTHRNRTNNQILRTPVEIATIILDPEYKPGKPQHNVALLLIYAEFHWEVEPFFLPRHNLADITRLHTFVDEWMNPKITDNRYEAITIRKNITNNSEMCGEIGHSSEWICILSSGGRDVYTKVDRGSPIFYINKTLKRFLGLYTGRNMGKSIKGFVYESIIPSWSWMERFMREHPIPPFYY